MAPKTGSQGTYTYPALYNNPSVSENTEEDQNSIDPYISSQLRDLACTADPNGGRCLITRRGTPIDASHLVAQTTEDDILAKLKYVWMVGYEQLNVDIRYNILFLRVDWHQLFNHNQWMLVPQIHILRELKRIYLVEGHKSFNLAEVFTNSIYMYYLLPAPTMQEYICRFPEEDTHHAPPYPNLGALPSHVRPHFVVFNTGLKLQALGGVKFQLLDMMRNIVPRLDEAVEMLLIIESCTGCGWRSKFPPTSSLIPPIPPRVITLKQDKDHHQDQCQYPNVAVLLFKTHRVVITLLVHLHQARTGP